MSAPSESPFRPNLQSWVSSSTWNERIITFDPSWFTLTMGTGIVVQLMNNFPWPATWLKNLGYCFWILNIVLFVFFTTMGCLRLIMYPKVARSVLDDFSQTSYLGAIPISLDTITTGIALYYNSNTTAMYVAEVFYWIGVTMTALVGVGGIFVMYKTQGTHTLDQVTGVWLLSFIPMIVTAALGASLSPYLLGNNCATILIVSFIMLSLGLGLAFIITTIYFWRLMVHNLPPRDAIVSCFVAVGPFSMGAFAVLGLATDLSRFITVQEFVFTQSWNRPYNATTHEAVAQMIIWLGVIFAFMLLGVATFFLLEACASVISKVPKSFNIGFWSFVFPWGVYANAFCKLGTTLRNDGIKGWAAACVMVTVLLWLMCAVLTTYKGLWLGKTFVAPGLQGYVEKEHIDELHKRSIASSDETVMNGHSSARDGSQKTRSERELNADGTYRRVNSPNDATTKKRNDNAV